MFDRNTNTSTGPVLLRACLSALLACTAGVSAMDLDRLSDERPTPDEQLIRAQEQAQVREALGKVRKRIGELGWDILSDRLTQDDPRTLEDLGRQWGLSRERVRQVEKSTRSFLSRVLADFEEAA